MEDEPLVTTGCVLRTQLDVFANKGGNVHFSDFTRMLQDGSAEITLSECWEMFQFACDQLGFWAAEWSFSPVDSPNYSAKLEIEGWEILCQNLLNSLVMEHMPEQQSLLEDRKHQTVLFHLLTRRVEYNQGKPFAKMAAFVLGQMSSIFKRLGFYSIGKCLYKCGLYPKGTIARP